MAHPRIHILGLGSIGLFAAHILAEARPQPAITLLLHRSDLLQDYINNDSCISLKTHQGEVSRQTDYDFEVLRDDSWFHVVPTSDSEKHRQPSIGDKQEAREPIQYLVVAVKAWQTTSALVPLRHRLGPHSNILFIQNGSGIIEAVDQMLFQDPITRPRYTIGVTSHCINLLSPFKIEHAAFAKTSLGIVPCGQDPKGETPDKDPSSRNDPTTETAPAKTDKDEASNYLANLLTSVPRINAINHPYPTLLQLQLEKLTINAVNNPICALANSKNEHLWSETTLRNALFAEISAVAIRLPELAAVPGVKERFSGARLEEVVLENLRKTEKGTCSMVWDLRGRRRTEVRFINGYWVRRGREVGVDTPVNEELVRRIEEREAEYL